MYDEQTFWGGALWHFPPKDLRPRQASSIVFH
jgi:hypothetical protein